MEISVCILTKNAAPTLAATLDSLKSFPEIILFDNGSDDATFAIAEHYSNVTVHKFPFLGFGPMRNKAAELAQNDWILAIDSDEIVSDELLQKLPNLKLDESVAYTFARHNYYNGKRIKGCGWDPEWVTRLYNRKTAHYSSSLVHESVVAKKTVKVPAPLIHTPYRNLNDFLSKMQHYSTLFAEQNRGKKRATLMTAIGHGLFAFIRSYFLKRGIFCGKEGFIISFYNANTTFYKYLKLAEFT